MTTVLETREAEVAYSKSSTKALHSLSLTITEGESLGIVGESGSGKSTLGRLLVGALRASSGSVLVEGQDWRTVKRSNPLRRRVQMVFQDPYGALNPHLSARAAVAEAMAAWDLAPRRQAQEKAVGLLEEVGLSGDVVERRPSQLSGGQCQRVGIARALAVDPRVLVADEPTSSLDVSVQAQILNLLAELSETRRLTLVLISHDLHVIRHATDRTLVMYAGQVVEAGSTERVFSAPAHPYTQLLMDSIPGGPGSLAMGRSGSGSHLGCAFADRCAYAVTACRAAPIELTAWRGASVRCIRTAELNGQQSM